MNVDRSPRTTGNPEITQAIVISDLVETVTILKPMSFENFIMMPNTHVNICSGRPLFCRRLRGIFRVLRQPRSKGSVTTAIESTIENTSVMCGLAVGLMRGSSSVTTAIENMIKSTIETTSENTNESTSKSLVADLWLMFDGTTYGSLQVQDIFRGLVDSVNGSPDVEKCEGKLVLVEGETINHADRELWAGIVTFETAKSVSSSTSTRNVAYIYISTRESPYLLAYSSRPAVYPC